MWSSVRSPSAPAVATAPGLCTLTLKDRLAPAAPLRLAAAALPHQRRQRHELLQQRRHEQPCWRAHAYNTNPQNVESCQVPPSPQFNAEQAVRVQLDALAANNQPWPQHGIQTAYEWAVDVGGLDPSLYFGFPKDLYHFDHFLGMFANKLPELVNLQSYDILGNAQELPATDDSPPTWVVRARVVGGAGVAQPSAEFEFQLRRKTVGARKGALMTHMIRRVAQQ